MLRQLLAQRANIVARVTPATHFAGSELEVELVARLARMDSPVAGLEARVAQRVFVRNGFKIALRTYFEPVPARVRRVGQSL